MRARYRPNDIIFFKLRSTTKERGASLDLSRKLSKREDQDYRDRDGVTRNSIPPSKRRDRATEFLNPALSIVPFPLDANPLAKQTDAFSPSHARVRLRLRSVPIRRTHTRAPSSRSFLSPPTTASAESFHSSAAPLSREISLYCVATESVDD